MSEFTSEKFPTGSLKPKSETGVLNFLKKYPNFDGSDVTIAIFDSVSLQNFIYCVDLA